MSNSNNFFFTNYQLGFLCQGASCAVSISGVRKLILFLNFSFQFKGDKPPLSVS